MRKLDNDLRRKVGYAIATVIGAIFFAFGIVTAEQLNTLEGAIDALAPILWPVATGIATAKTHRGSGDPTTREDVDAAYQAAQPAAIPEPTPPTVAEAEAALAEARANIQPSPEEAAAAAYRQTTHRE